MTDVLTTSVERLDEAARWLSKAEQSLALSGELESERERVEELAEEVKRLQQRLIEAGVV